MKYIKIWNEQELRYRTISENEGLEEFQELKTLPEIFEYMNRRNDDGVLGYGIYFFREQARNLEEKRKKETVEFIYDGLAKNRIRSYASANLKYIDAEGKVTVIKNETMLFDIYGEVVEPYIFGVIPSLGTLELTEGDRTLELIQNFNDNMTRIKIWNEQEKRYRTISENEGLEEFEAIKSFEELWEYMKRRNDEGVLYINELKTISYDRTEQLGDFIYDYGNGEVKKLKDRGS